MSVRISDPTHACLYDSTSGVAFGPVFASKDEAEDFLVWLSETDGRDAREIPEGSLLKSYQAWTGTRGEA